MTPTGTEARVCQDIAERQQRGIEKYGTTVEANPLSLIEWLRHQYAELLDAAVYCKRAIEEMGAAEPKPLQVEAGKFYERSDGGVVGPAERETTHVYGSTHPWRVGVLTYTDDGRCTFNAEDVDDLIREVPPPMEKAAEPQYRPFASAEEFKPHAHRMLSDGHAFYWVGTFTNERMWLSRAYEGIDWATAFKTFTFDDDSTPCGVRL